MPQTNNPAVHREIPYAQEISSFHGSGMAYPHFAYNSQFGYNLAGQPHISQGPTPNMFLDAPSRRNVAGGNPSKTFQTVNPKTLDVATLEFLACAEAAIENGGRNSMPPKEGVLKISNVSQLSLTFLQWKFHRCYSKRRQPKETG